MEKYELEKLRSLSCESVAMRLGLVVKQHKTLCCFHEDHTPSMAFKGSHFRCWSCGESGDTISLVQKVLHKDFLDACRWLADENNIILSEYKPEEYRPLKPFDASRYLRYFERPWLNEEARRFLFDERRIDPRVVRWCRLTSWKDKQGVPWLQIPYYNQEGRLVGVQNRNLRPPTTSPEGECPNASPRGGLEGVIPRFRFPSGSQCGIYNLPVLNLLKPGEQLFITEGCSDCWAMLSAGHKAIAIPSATLLTKKDVEQLSIINSQLSISFEMFPDNDAPGERLFLQLQKVLPSLVHHQLPSGCKDYSELYLSTITKTKTQNG